MPHATFIKTNRQLQRAAARGDIDAAIRWTEVLLAQMRAARTLVDLHTAKPTPKPRRAKPKPDIKAETPPPPTMPVMLDPDGFSPGGTPNWFLNQQRLERAGLPSAQAPLTKAALRRQQHPTNT
ncbi:MAG: hypothetical protein EON61_27430 [Alphaproteobacteria bacterium]|nr:MAG: hypothetical protein EON61_27430 [Alphaproteobacteria bacterium]